MLYLQKDMHMPSLKPHYCIDITWLQSVKNNIIVVITSTNLASKFKRFYNMTALRLTLKITKKNIVKFYLTSAK